MDEFCGDPPGSFAKMLKDLAERESEMREKTNKRIKELRKSRKK